MKDCRVEGTWTNPFFWQHTGQTGEILVTKLYVLKGHIQISRIRGDLQNMHNISLSYPT